MPRLLRILGLVLVFSGVVWILQGLGILTVVDSFMIGEQQWIVWGGLAVAAGLGLVALSRRGQARGPRA